MDARRLIQTLKAVSFSLSVVLFGLPSVLCGCSGGSGDGAMGMGDGLGGDGAFSGPAGTGSNGVANGTAAGGAASNPSTCVPGVPATSQIPRLLNRQYEAAVRDLLGVTSLAGADTPISELLVADFSGPMTPDAFRIYQEVGGEIARAVMTGPNRSRFIDCDPAAAGCLEQTIRTFGRRAFRRPLSEPEVERFLRLTQSEPAGTPDEVAETILFAFLVSPSFLLLPELTTAQASSVANAYQLSSYEVATRLSLMLWGSVPDDLLNAAADADQLQTAEQILGQAERMIAMRERAGPAIAEFHRDWAQMNNGNAHWWKTEHDGDLYPLYSASAKQALRDELDAFFVDVAFADGSFADLLLSEVAFVNRDSAALYGLDPRDFGAELTRVELDAGERPGFMTRAGFLSSYAGYDATSPILRGAFVSVYLLGVNPGPPLPGATMMTVSGDFPTQRAYVEALTGRDECAGCHAIVNPPGFVLEGFDGVGALQQVDPRGGAIDSTVTTAMVNFGDGKLLEISSPAQLMQEIAQTPKARQLYAQAWVAYAYGRGPNGNDRCLVDELDRKLSTDGYRIVDLLADLTQADSFRLRVRETP